MRHIISSLITTSLILFSIASFADPGDLDLSFGNHKGWVPLNKFVPYAIIQQTDGKAVIGGTTSTSDGLTGVLSLARYTPDGTLDSSFNGHGIASVKIGYTSYVMRLIQDSTGKLLAGGGSNTPIGGFAYTNIAIARFNQDGSLDTSFNGTGTVFTQFVPDDGGVVDIAEQSDGKIVVLTPKYLVRYLNSGTLDTSFNATGYLLISNNLTSSPQSLLIQHDGKVVVAGGQDHQAIFYRFNNDGSVDPTFNGGSVSYSVNDESRINHIVQLADDKLVACGVTMVYGGTPFQRFLLVKLDTDGSLDSGFNAGVPVTTSINNLISATYTLVLQQEGKILLPGVGRVDGSSLQNFILARYNDDGSLDTTFSSNGLFIGNLGDELNSQYGELLTLVQQTDEKLIGIGFRDGNSELAFLARFSNDDNEHDGDEDHDEHGHSVTTADIDGDGTDDIISGAPAADITINTSLIKGAGSIKIISGKDHTVLKRFTGNVANQHFGSALAAVPDQNSDGVPDLLVGEPSLNRVSLYSGADGSLIKTVVSGTAWHNQFGSSIAVGDINNDAIADLVVGAPHEGKVYVYDGVTVFNTVNPVPLYARTATRSGEQFGAAVTVDNQHHLLVGSPAHKKLKLTNVGAVEVFNGSDGVSAALDTLEGTQAKELFGSSISTLASNGNWIIGSPGANNGKIINGKTVVTKGVGKVQIFSSADASLIITTNGNARGDHFGSAINAAADIDKDGTSDLVVGASTSDVSKPINGKYTLLKRSGRVNMLSGAKVLGP